MAGRDPADLSHRGGHRPGTKGGGRPDVAWPASGLLRLACLDNAASAALGAASEHDAMTWLA